VDEKLASIFRASYRSDIAEGRCDVVDDMAMARPLSLIPLRLPDLTFRQCSFAVLFALAACATASAPTSSRVGPSVAPAPELSIAERAASFQLKAPAPDQLGPELELWATRYHTPIVAPAGKSTEDATALMGKDGSPISPPLRHADWCSAALQGSLALKGANGKLIAYSYLDAAGPEQTNCDDQLGSLPDGVKRATRRARFRIVNHAQGCGSRHIPLLPFRTIAVDPGVIPLESVIFAPQLRGRTFKYGDKLYVHDGYLFAGDRGGAIHKGHIDIFTDDSREQPFPNLITASAGKTFSAHIVEAGTPEADALRSDHARVCAGVDPGKAD
jgi:3D (Asp-Asp-Asp) domain-containing protein